MAAILDSLLWAHFSEDRLLKVSRFRHLRFSLFSQSPVRVYYDSSSRDYSPVEMSFRNEKKRTNQRHRLLSLCIARADPSLEPSAKSVRDHPLPHHDYGTQSSSDRSAVAHSPGPVGRARAAALCAGCAGV